MYPVSFQWHHMRKMQLQPAQAVDHVGDDVLRLMEGPYAVTLMSDGEPILATGAVPMWEDRGYLWACLSVGVNGYTFRRVHAWAKAFLAGLPFRRLEAAVDVDFEAGHRWVRALGFDCETPDTVMRAFRNGVDCKLYALVKGA